VRYLHENRGCDGTLTQQAPVGMMRAAMHGYHEVVTFLGQCGYKPLLGSLYLTIPSSNVESLRALCLYSTEGCLFDALQQAERYHRTEMIELLNTLIAPNVLACDIHKHSHSGPRRCQRLHAYYEQHADADADACDGEGVEAPPNPCCQDVVRDP